MHNKCIAKHLLESYSITIATKLEPIVMTLIAEKINRSFFTKYHNYNLEENTFLKYLSLLLPLMNDF